MAVKSESVLVNQTLRLTLKAFLLSLALLSLRGAGPEVASLFLFLGLLIFFYFKPLLNNRKFLVSALALVVLPILLPPVGGRLELILALVWGVAIFLILGVKDLIILKRQSAYELAHLLILIGFTSLFFLGVIPQVVIFIALFLLFREFYFTLAPYYPQRLTLIAAAESFVLLEMAWVISFLSISFLAAATFITLTAFVFHDFILYHLKGALSREIVLKNTTLFIALGLVIMLL